MTREQAISHWKDVVRVVFVADGNLIDQWRERLAEAAKMPSDEREQVCDEYVTAVAEEILSKTTDEELEKF